MKKLYILLLLCLLTVQSFAQWEKQIGVNLLPIAIGSYEVSGEFSHIPQLAIVANAGYLHKTGFEVIWDDDVGDGIENRRTSGAFYKMGVRYYFVRPTAQPRKVKSFVGVLLIGSHYSKTADTTDLNSHFTGDLIYAKTSRKGFSWGPAISFGLSFRLSSRLSLDTGIQNSYMVRDDDRIGRRSRNYEPGFGVRTSGVIPTIYRHRKFFPTNSQVIVTLKYKI